MRKKKPKPEALDPMFWADSLFRRMEIDLVRRTVVMLHHDAFDNDKRAHMTFTGVKSILEENGGIQFSQIPTVTHDKDLDTWTTVFIDDDERPVLTIRYLDVTYERIDDSPPPNDELR